MAAGPGSGHRYGGIREIVKHGETGFLFARRDVASMADAVAKLLKEPDLAKEMGANARRMAAEFVSPAAAQHEELYKELPVGRKPGA
jgi:glycosyltransferase involved in cell wall biosynthesis